MTTAKKADKRAAKQGSGQGSVSNAAGTETGPGSSAESRSKKDGVHGIAGTGSPKTARNRPGHKANA